MSFYGTGPQDWVELDPERVAADRVAALIEAIDDHRAALEALLGAAFEIDLEGAGTANLVVGEAPRYRAEVLSSGRLCVTSLADAHRLL